MIVCLILAFSLNEPKLGFLPSIVVFANPSVASSISSLLLALFSTSSNWFCLMLALNFLLCLFLSSSFVAEGFWSTVLSFSSSGRRTVCVLLRFVAGCSMVGSSNTSAEGVNMDIFICISKVWCDGWILKRF